MACLLSLFTAFSNLKVFCLCWSRFLSLCFRIQRFQLINLSENNWLQVFCRRRAVYWNVQVCCYYLHSVKRLQLVESWLLETPAHSNLFRFPFSSIFHYNITLDNLNPCNLEQSDAQICLRTLHVLAIAWNLNIMLNIWEKRTWNCNFLLSWTWDKVLNGYETHFLPHNHHWATGSWAIFSSFVYMSCILLGSCWIIF